MAKSVQAVAATMASLRVPVTINPIPGAFRTRRREYLAHQFFNPLAQNIEEVPTSARSLRQWIRRQEVAAGRFAGRIQTMHRGQTARRNLNSSLDAVRRIQAAGRARSARLLVQAMRNREVDLDLRLWFYNDDKPGLRLFIQQLLGGRLRLARPTHEEIEQSVAENFLVRRHQQDVNVRVSKSDYDVTMDLMKKMPLSNSNGGKNQ